MKKLKCFLSLLFVTVILSCASDDDSRQYLTDADAPANLSAIFTIASDNSGKVTIRPNGEGANTYAIIFGDATVGAEIIAPGEAIDHIYPEGTFQVKIIGTAVNGLTTEYTQTLTVSFIAPANLVVSATPESGNPYKINVTATANFETYFEVFFGETDPDTAVVFNEGQTVSHTYAATGTYNLRVVAHSGGAATAEYTQVVTVYDPLLMPITFESPTLNYSFTNFGNAVSSVVNNPSVSGGNTSAKVGKLVKNPGAEVWAGSFLELGQPIDFSSMTKISIKTYSPIAGAVVKLKLENLANNNINTEVDALTTVANDWETLTFDFAGINNGNNYQRVVVFFDFGNGGTGASFYFDDIALTAGVPIVTLPLTFQNSALTYTFTGFGGASASVIDNPQSNGINTTTKVGKLHKNTGSETWAGAFIELGQPIDFSSLNKIKMKVWSPTAGSIVKLKLENLANSSINIKKMRQQLLPAAGKN
ncbi:hypothetical protein [Flavobacterium sp. 3HN19-14]|uniref:hypothetical protein n=1 Tax=Flavobacterium sp. 3HN19-14 TaxID=3448133 RepID=UPI003EE3F85D